MQIKFPRIKVTVKNVYEECSHGLKVGDSFIFEDFTKAPAGFCEGATSALFPCLYALSFGACFPFEENQRSIHTTCPDGGKVDFFSEVIEEGDIKPCFVDKEKHTGPNPRKMIISVDEVKGKCFYNYKKGDSFEVKGLRTIEGFCGAAYHTLFPVLFALNFGGTYPFEENDNSLSTITCPDGGNIRFKVTRIEEEEEKR